MDDEDEESTPEQPSSNQEQSANNQSQDSTPPTDQSEAAENQPDQPEDSSLPADQSGIVENQPDQPEPAVEVPSNQSDVEDDKPADDTVVDDHDGSMDDHLLDDTVEDVDAAVGATNESVAPRDDSSDDDEIIIDQVVSKAESTIPLNVLESEDTMEMDVNKVGTSGVYI